VLVFFILFVYLCINAGDPTFKLVWLGSHWPAWSRHLFVPVTSQNLESQRHIICRGVFLCSKSWRNGSFFAL